MTFLSRIAACPAAAFVVLLATQQAAAAPFDHLQCFRIKDSLPKAEYTADITPSDPIFVAALHNCTIRMPARLLCVDAEKTNVSPPPPGAPDGLPGQAYFCYRAKCPPTQPSTALADQFGLHLFSIKSTQLVCAPVPPPAISTTTTSTTMAPCPDADDDDFTTCAGDCDDGNALINPDATETCNGADDNCDDSVDEGNPGGGAACMTGQPGICSSGTTVCSGGMVTCSPNAMPVSETCDGLDNDCDGVVDQGNPDGGAACNTGLSGQCAPGTTNCVAGTLVCSQNSMPVSETCDGLDNDCDGSVDQGNPGGGAACMTGQPGVCSSGTTACVVGTVICSPNTMASAEVCDSLDNDCDGFVDEGGVCVLPQGSACSTGVQCASSFCVDGFCCGTSCSSSCQACSAAKKGGGSDGTCGNIAFGTDPDNECLVSSCNGSGACQF